MSSGSVSSGAERQWQRRLELEEQHSEAQLEGKSAGMLAMDQLGMGLLFRIGFPSVQYNRRKKAPTHVHVEPCLLQRRLNCFPKLCNVEYIYCFLLLATGQVRDPFLF